MLTESTTTPGSTTTALAQLHDAIRRAMQSGVTPGELFAAVCTSPSVAEQTGDGTDNARATAALVAWIEANTIEHFCSLVGATKQAALNWKAGIVPSGPFRPQIEEVTGIPASLWRGRAGGARPHPVQPRDPVTADPSRAARDPLRPFAPKGLSLTVLQAPIFSVVVPFADVARPGDVFRCEALQVPISAGACVARQQQALEAQRAQGRGGTCAACTVGAEVAASVE